MQPDFPFPNEPFALVAETTLDGERLTREAEQLARDRATSDSLQLQVGTVAPRGPSPQSEICNLKSEINETHTNIWAEAQAKYDAGDRSWTQTNEATFYYFLEVLPPLMTRGAFAPGEAWKDNRDGHPLYLWFRQRGPIFEARIATRHEMGHLSNDL
jgi:hypothetical protein